MTASEDLTQRAIQRRQELGISQGELARRMKRRGHPWFQMTVGRTESGERPLRLDEAVSLSALLAMPLLTDEPDSPYLAQARQAVADLQGMLGQQRADHLDEREEDRAEISRLTNRLAVFESALTRVANLTTSTLTREDDRA